LNAPRPLPLKRQAASRVPPTTFPTRPKAVHDSSRFRPEERPAPACSVPSSGWVHVSVAWPLMTLELQARPRSSALLPAHQSVRVTVRLPVARRDSSLRKAALVKYGRHVVVIGLDIAKRGRDVRVIQQAFGRVDISFRLPHQIGGEGVPEFGALLLGCRSFISVCCAGNAPEQSGRVLGWCHPWRPTHP
jgi:hypothetical protein